MSESKNKNDRLEVIFKSLKMLLNLIGQTLIELFYGIKNGSISYPLPLTWGVLFNVLTLSGFDKKLLVQMKLGVLYPSHFTTYAIYSMAGSLLGFLVWGIIQALRKARMTADLTKYFTESGLKSPTGKLPDFISDKPQDEFVRELVITNAFMPLSRFVEAKRNLEATLKVYIDDIKEHRSNGTISITYSHHEIPNLFELMKNKNSLPQIFMIGKTRAKVIESTLDQTPHLLIGGQTGGGKSTFLRSFITTLYCQNPEYEFILVDMKGGLEFQLFEHRKRIDVISNHQAVKNKLTTIDELLSERFSVLKENGCKDLEKFLKLTTEQIKMPSSMASLKTYKMSRLIIVIDEAAELFLSSSRSTISDTQDMVRKVIRIAAQGRAVGIHLVVATQKPDSNAINTQIKANLTGILSFPMSTLGASMSILGNGRAKELPNIAGRAIWKNGLDQYEVQTPFISPEEVKTALDQISPITQEALA